jgi:hypothetical protein
VLIWFYKGGIDPGKLTLRAYLKRIRHIKRIVRMQKNEPETADEVLERKLEDEEDL